MITGSGDFWMARVQVPVSDEILTDPPDLRKFFVAEWQEALLDLEQGPRLGPSPPRRPHVLVPYGRPAGEYRRAR